MDAHALHAYDETLKVFIAILSIILPVATVGIALRIWIRLKFANRLKIDDYILLASHVVNLACTGFWLYVYVRQRAYVPRSPELIDALSNPFVVAIGTYVLSSLLVKVAIGLFFLRIAYKKWQKYVVQIPTIIYAVCILVSFTIVMFRCGLPIDPAHILASEECVIGTWIEQVLGLNIAALNALCDWIFAIIPIHILLTSERMSRDAKLSSSFIIGLAIAGSTVSIIRLPYFARSSLGPQVFEMTHIIIFLSILETAVGATAISMVTLKPLLKMMRKTVSHDSYVSANAVLAEGQRPPGKADWMYSACVTKTGASKKIDLKSMRGIGILPDVTPDGTNASRDDEEMSIAPTRSRGQSFTMIRIASKPIPPINEVLQEESRMGSVVPPSESDTTRIGSEDSLMKKH